MSSDLLLPAGARLVHVGPHKTGSTASQVALLEPPEVATVMQVALRESRTAQA